MSSSPNLTSNSELTIESSPDAQACIYNIEVNSIVREVETLLDKFCDYDEEPSFVFTANYGMSFIGHHDDEYPDNIKTLYAI